MTPRKAVRTFALATLSFAAVFNLLGGAGTSCVAVNPGRFESMASLAPYAWLYWVFTVAGIATGLYGVFAVIALVRRTPLAFLHALASLLTQLVVAGIHTYTSVMLRGSGAPANMRAIVTAIALALLGIGLALRLFEPVDTTASEGAGDSGVPLAEIAGASLGAVPVLLGMERLMAHTHTFDGVNYAAAGYVELAAAGLAALGAVAGGLAVRDTRTARARRIQGIGHGIDLLDR